MAQKSESKVVLSQAEHINNPFIHIHVNSFMYEPIIDMSDSALRGLYTDIKRLSPGLV
ncbi:MAG: hypothetical protein ACK5LN_05440 [Propioniciclava sp.]